MKRHHPSPQSIGGEEGLSLLAPLFQVEGSRGAVIERNLANVIIVNTDFHSIYLCRHSRMIR